MTTDGIMQEMKQLIQYDSDDFHDFSGIVVAAMREHLGSDIAFISEFRDDQKVIRNLSGDGASIGIEEGASFPLSETYCYRMSRGELPNIIENARTDERVRDLPITEQLDIRTYVSVPITFPDGETYGTLCCLYHEVEDSIRERDVTFMRVLADIIGDYFGRRESGIKNRRLKSERIRAIIDQQAIRMVFQPIVDIRTRSIVGAEALARFDGEPRRTPDVWFSEAWEVGLGHELELTAVRLALAQMQQLPEGAYLSVNVSPTGLQSEAFFESLEMVDSRRVVVEVTEHTIVQDYESLMAARHRLHGTGSRLAVDDAGAGYSGLSHIIRIRPEIMKLDVSLTRDIHKDEARQALAASAVTFAARMGVDLVAEGVETAEDALALQLLGMRYGQGYLFAKPGPLPIAS